MSIRFADQEHEPDAEDFIVRQRHPSLPQLIVLFLSALIIAISITVSVTSKPALIAILFILVTSVGWYVVVQTQQTRDLLLTTEFQNALFSSALGLNNKFCMIVKPDGAIVYVDRGFQDMFPAFLKHSQRNLGPLLEFGNVVQKDRDAILAAVGRGASDKVIFSIQSSDQQIHKVLVNIELIQRPSGFMLLRGRDYVDQRSDGPAPQPTRVMAPQAHIQPDNSKKKW